jgi:hypothetical protein
MLFPRRVQTGGVGLEVGSKLVDLRASPEAGSVEVIHHGNQASNDVSASGVFGSDEVRANETALG